LIKIGSEYIWLWVAIEEPENKMMLGFSISKEQNLLIAERSVSKLVNIYAQYPVSTYMEALVGIHLKHVIY
jgi:transposase-like protein